MCGRASWIITPCREGECTQCGVSVRGCYKRLAGCGRLVGDLGGGLEKPDVALDWVLAGSRGIGNLHGGGNEERLKL